MAPKKIYRCDPQYPVDLGPLPADYYTSQLQQNIPYTAYLKICALTQFSHDPTISTAQKFANKGVCDFYVDDVAVSGNRAEVRRKVRFMFEIDIEGPHKIVSARRLKKKKQQGAEYLGLLVNEKVSLESSSDDE